MTQPARAAQLRVAATSFLALFSIVGIALYGLPFFYDFMVREFGWSRAQVTSGNAISKLVVGPLFGFLAGWLVDRFGPRRLMVAGILMAGAALVGLGAIHTLAGFYFFYFFNALGNFCGGPLPNQVLLSRWFTAARGRAMGFAYLGIGVGGAMVPFLAVWLTRAVGWQGALQALGVLIVVAALPLALFVPEAPPAAAGTPTPDPRAAGPASIRTAIYLFALVFGIGLGGEYMVIPLMAAELFGVRVLGRAMGVVLTADGVAEALAPVLVGRMRDVTGSYATGFAAVIGFAITGAIAVLFLPPTSPPVPTFVGAQHAAPYARP